MAISKVEVQAWEKEDTRSENKEKSRGDRGQWESGRCRGTRQSITPTSVFCLHATAYLLALHLLMSHIYHLSW